MSCRKNKSNVRVQIAHNLKFLLHTETLTKRDRKEGEKNPKLQKQNLHAAGIM